MPTPLDFLKSQLKKTNLSSYNDVLAVNPSHGQKLEILNRALTLAPTLNHQKKNLYPIKYPKNPGEWLAAVHRVNGFLVRLRSQSLDDRQHVWISIDIMERIMSIFEVLPPAYRNLKSVKHPYESVAKWYADQPEKIHSHHAQVAEVAGATKIESELISEAIKTIIDHSLDLEQFVFFGIGCQNLESWYRSLFKIDSWQKRFEEYPHKVRSQLNERQRK